MDPIEPMELVQPVEPGKAERLYSAWRKVAPPPFDEESGRARFLDSATTALLRSRAGPRRFTRMRVVAALAAALTCAAMIWVVARPARSLRFSTETGEGQVRAWLATDSSREMPLSFSEGTLLVMQSDSRGRVEQLGPRGASFLIERGAVRARVVHRPGADWRFLAGPFEVEVTGTALNVRWDPSGERLSVGVDEGAVLVRGPSLGASQTVRAGQTCVVDLPSHSVHIEGRETGASGAPFDSASATAAHEDSMPAFSTGAAPTPLSPAPAIPRPPAAPALSTPWTELEARGDYDAAYSAAIGLGLTTLYRSASADDLLRLAQVGQLSGHRRTERDALLACRRRYSGTDQAAIAAYKLGRASSSREAAGWFETFLSEKPGASLAREALGRLIEARLEETNETAARNAATRYLAAYPDGPHATLARKVLGRAKP